MLFTYEIGDEEKAEFLEYLALGLPPNQAAKEVGTTGTRIKRIRRPGTQFYDAEFAKKWDEIEESGEHLRALKKQVRDMVWDSAFEGNWTARWKLALTYLEEFEWDRHQNLNVNMQMQVLTQALPGLTMEELERVQRALAEKEPKLLEAVPDVIEAA